MTIHVDSFEQLTEALFVTTQPATATPLFPNPDSIGQCEYGALYELIRNIVASNEFADESPVETVELIKAALGEVADWAGTLRSALDAALPSPAPIGA